MDYAVLVPQFVQIIGEGVCDEYEIRKYLDWGKGDL